MKKLSSPFALIKRSIEVFFERKNLIYFLKIYAILVPFAIFFHFQDSLIKIDTTTMNLTNLTLLLNKYGWLLGAAVIVNLAYLVISFWISATGIKAVSVVTEGGPLNAKSALQFTWKKLFLFSILYLLVGLVTGLGYILIIIPGVLFSVWFHFSGFEFITKDIGVTAAMGESKRIVAGKFWQVLGRFIIFALFGILVQAIFLEIPSGFGAILLPLFGAIFILPYFLLYRELLA